MGFIHARILYSMYDILYSSQLYVRSASTLSEGESRFDYDYRLFSKSVVVHLVKVRGVGQLLCVTLFLHVT